MPMERRAGRHHSGFFAAPGHERRLRGTRNFTKSPSSPNPRKAIRHADGFVVARSATPSTKFFEVKCWLYEEFCGTNPVSAVKLRWHQRGFANATPDMLCAQSQRTIYTKLPWVALKTAAKTRIEMEWRSRYGSANDMRSFLRSVSGASLIRIGVSTKNFEDPKILQVS